MTQTLGTSPGALLAKAPALYVFDGVLPPQLPETGNLLLIDPPTTVTAVSTELLAVRGTMTRTQVTDVEVDDPLLQYVDLDDLRVARARDVEVPPWARTLVSAAGGPLLLAGEVSGRRIAIFCFDLHQSNLPLCGPQPGRTEPSSPRGSPRARRRCDRGCPSPFCPRSA